MKQAILFLSNKSSSSIMNNFNMLLPVQNMEFDCFFLYHKQEDILPKEIKSTNHYVFTSDILHELGYTPLQENLLPGSNHFPLLKFYLDNLEYDYYWMIEDDVIFTGNWKYFFNTFANDSIDFISTNIKKYTKFSQWYWWNSLVTGKEEISDTSKIRSFNPIYRLSNRALACINEALRKKWSGHHEVLIPTLLYHRGYTIADIGGKGPFVVKGKENKFYNEETLSYLPLELGNRPNTIYHPIKEKITINTHQLKKNCVISAVGTNSLHREWLKGSSDPDFDLHLIVYDNSYNNFYSDTIFITQQKGYKMKLVYNYLKDHPEYLEQYDYFFIPDDDIQMDAFNISQLFHLMKYYNLQIAQPGLSNSYYSYEHTLREKLCILRYTNFIEIMLPCFSRKSLKKILPTFNENNSGWGIEYHWPLLITSTGKDIAIIDQLNAVHTRPIQSYNEQNIKELMSYTQKYNLSRDIVIFNFIPIKDEILIKRKDFITTRETYIRLKNLGDTITKTLIRLFYASPKDSINATALINISQLLVSYTCISEKRKYSDLALLILKQAHSRLEKMKEGINLKYALLKYSWYIKYLSHRKIINDNADEILEDVCEYFNRYSCSQINILNISELIELSWYYIIRIKDCNINTPLHQTENKIFIELIRILTSKQKDILLLQNTNQKQQAIVNLILLLHQIKTSGLLVDKIANQQTLTNLLEFFYSSTNISSFLKRYISFLGTDLINDLQLENKLIKPRSNCKKHSTEISSQLFLDLYLLKKMHIKTSANIFRLYALELLEYIYIKQNLLSSILEENGNINKIENLTRIGLIIYSLLSEEETELDYFILSNYIHKK